MQIRIAEKKNCHTKLTWTYETCFIVCLHFFFFKVKALFVHFRRYFILWIRIRSCILHVDPKTPIRADSDTDPHNCS